MVRQKGKKKINESDPTMDHCTRVIETNRLKLKCNYCRNEYWGGTSRMKNHLAGTRKDVAPCTQVSEDVRNVFLQLLESKEKKIVDVLECFDDGEVCMKKGTMDAFVVKGTGRVQQTINQIVKKREPVIRDICRCLYGNALPFNLVKSPLFIQMLKSVGEYGKGLKPPTYHEARVSYLKKEVEYVELDLEVYKKEWKRTGCTLMSDGWSDGKQRSITNFLVNSPRGTVFLKSIDTSGMIKTSQRMFELLDKMIDEIGEENVVQVVTDSASNYVGAGDLLENKRKKLFWNPCSAHLLDLMLGDIGEMPVYKDTLEKAKQITVFIYRHSWVLDLFRKYSKQRELARPAITRFATSYLTLKSFQERKIQLRAMFASEEWATSTYSSSEIGRRAQDIVLGDSRFWKSIKFCLKSVLPLVKVLRLVDGDSKPPMGYIYEAMDRAKEEIRNNLNGVKNRYERIWKIIDNRWDLQLHRPLHATGYLNGLSDMESDDEWITEKEDPCLPQDHSWMDVQECFQDDEGTSCRKRKRGILYKLKSIVNTF